MLLLNQEQQPTQKKMKIKKLDRNQTSEEQISQAAKQLEKAMLRLELCQVFYICPDEMKQAKLASSDKQDQIEQAIEWRIADLCNYGRNIKYRCDDFNDLAEFLNEPYNAQ